MESYQAIEETMFTALQELLLAYPTATILVTGHSLGGAIATYAALDIKRFIAPDRVVHFYTFGSPRPGNSRFADFVMNTFPNGEYSRVTHYKDLVPHVPAEVEGYKHAGNEIWYYNPPHTPLAYKECTNEPGQPENRTCADYFAMAFSIDDHREYLGLQISFMCNAYEIPNHDSSKDNQFSEDFSGYTEEELWLILGQRRAGQTRVIGNEI